MDLKQTDSYYVITDPTTKNIQTIEEEKKYCYQFT